MGFVCLFFLVLFFSLKYETSVQCDEIISRGSLYCLPTFVILCFTIYLNVSVSTTKRALNYLVEIGYIEKIERFLDPTGRQSSNLYKINIDNIENNNIKLFNSKPNTTDKNPKEEKTKSNISFIGKHYSGTKK